MRRHRRFRADIENLETKALLTPASPIILEPAIGPVWYQAWLQTPGTDPGGSNSSGSNTSTQKSSDGLSTTTGTTSYADTYSQTFAPFAVSMMGTTWNVSLETGWKLEDQTTTDTTTTTTVAGGTDTSTTHVKTDIQMSGTIIPTYPGMVSPPTGTPVTNFTITASGSHNNQVSQSTSDGTITSTGTGSDSGNWTYTASGQPQQPVGSYNFNETDTMTTRAEQSQGTSGVAGSADIVISASSKPTIQESGTPGQNPSTWSTSNATSNSGTSTASVSGSSGVGSVSYNMTMTPSANDTSNVSDSSGGGSTFQANGTASSAVTGLLTSPGVTMALNFAFGANFSTSMGRSGGTSSGDVADMPQTYGVGQGPPVVFAPNGPFGWTWWPYHMKGQPTVKLLPGTDTFSTYYNDIANQWNSGNLWWPYEGVPPAAGPNIQPTLPGTFITLPRVDAAALLPPAWNDIPLFTGTLLQPWVNSDKGTKGYAWATYYLGRMWDGAVVLTP